MKIVKAKLTDELERVIREGLQEYDIDTLGEVGGKDPISFYFRDGDDVVAAIVVRVLWGVLSIKHLWVHKDYRNSGYGTKLMNRALRFCKEKKCSCVYVETMNFQAPDFYKRFGFKIEFKRDCYERSASIYYMRKDFL